MADLIIHLPADPDLDENEKEADTLTDLATAAKQTDTEPSREQQQAGNYRKGKLRVHGLHIAIENPKGSVRSGTSRSGRNWHTTMAHHYGYFLGTKGCDKDHIDVFVGEQPDCELVHVINQINPETNRHDEHKIMLGFINAQQAREGYLANYAKDWQGLGSMVQMTMAQFKNWLLKDDTTQPVKAAGDTLLDNPGYLEDDPDDRNTRTKIGNTEQEGPGSEPTGPGGTGDKVVAARRPAGGGGGPEPDAHLHGPGGDGLAQPSQSRANKNTHALGRDYGAHTSLVPGQSYSMFVQKHHATRAGLHHDLRIGDRQGLFSWALRNGMPEPGEVRLGVQQPLHNFDYGSFEGEIPAGRYGAGSVNLEDSGQVTVSEVAPHFITFNRDSVTGPQRFTLARAQNVTGRKRDWYVIRHTLKPLSAVIKE